MPSRTATFAGFSTSVLSTNSLVLGTGTSTGTANQNLQVTGAAYIAGDTTNGLGLGIGVTLPSNPLDIRLNASSSTGASIRISPTSGGNAATITYLNNASSNFYTGILNSGGGAGSISGQTPYAAIVGTSAGTNPLLFVTNNTEALRIDSSQRVGIGTTNPVFKLSVYGNPAKSSADTLLFGVSSNDATNPFQFLIGRSAAGSGSYFTLQSIEQNVAYRNLSLLPNGGNITIGSTLDTGTASQPLQVSGGAYVSGSVGIGITNPSYKLHVVQNSSGATAGNSVDNFVVENSGNTGISILAGTTSQSAIAFGRQNAQTTGRIRYYHATDSLTLETNGSTEALRIDSSQRVGIGTTNPTSKLQVQGNTNINNTLPTTVSYASSFSVSAQETEPREVSFSNDGRTMYVLGNIGNDITYYTLSTPWDITSASYVSEFSVASQTTVPLGLTFKPDGTKFYIIGQTGTVGAGQSSVSEYSCSIPWNLTTAGYTTSYSVVSQEPTPQDVEFSNDGTKFYVVGGTANINQYSCTTPWSIASGVSFVSSFSINSQESQPQGFAFSQDGTKLLLTGTSGDDINYYTLSTPWDISTTSFVGIITGTKDGAPSGLYWKPDGTQLYVSGYTNDRVYQFNMTSDAQLEVTGKTKLYGDIEASQNLNVYGQLNVTGSINGTITSGTAQVSTAGTSINFTGIPSWAKRITVMFNGVSTTAATDFIIQIGPSSGVETTGYLGANQINGAGINSNASSNGFNVYTAGAAADTPSGQCVLSLIDASTNTWAATSIMAIATRIAYMGGAKPITGGVLSRLRITTPGGVATFDAGSINIMYEG